MNGSLFHAPLPTFGVWYTPMSDEPDPETCEAFRFPHQRFTIPARADIDPRQTAVDARTYIDEQTAFILIPGQAFDRYGNRHGRGGGWYDRFLAAVPRTWWRIGIGWKDAFTTELGTVQPWDQPIDTLLLQSRDGTWEHVQIKTRTVLPSPKS